MALVTLAGCGAEESVASRSAAAFREAQQKAATFEGAGHSHGHGATTPGVPQAVEEGHAGAAEPQEVAAAHDHGEAGTAVVDHSAMEHDGAEHADHADHAGHDEHAGPAAPAESGTHAGHAGHSPGEGNSAPGTAVTAPVAVSPGHPAAILRPDPLDAPAATSVLDAQRAAEMAAEMSGGGGHGNHGGTYSHVDAGRDPNAPDPHRQHGQAAPARPRQEHEPGHAAGGEHGAMQDAAAVYACPMHPEVTSTAPGECPKCGMALVERSEG